MKGVRQSAEIEGRCFDDVDGVERILTSSAVDIKIIKDRSSRISTTCAS